MGKGRFTSLTGSWSGAYRYPGDLAPETVFNIVIEEVGGAFTGRSEEPNTLRIGASRVVTSEIEGTRSGRDIAFTKFMDGSGGMDHAIRYEGVANEALTHISGTWSIPRDWSGTFFMSRDDLAAEEAATREEAVHAKR